MERSGVAILTLLGFGLALAVVLWYRPRPQDGEPPMGFGRIFDDCPKCSRKVVLAPGGAVKCPGCGERLAACGYCGQILVGAEVVHKDAAGQLWLCPKHHAEEQWETACLREFDGPEGRTPPPDSPRALAARRLYESRVQEVFRRDRSAREELFPYEASIRPGRNPPAAEPLPAAVVESYSFYERAVMKRDNGCVDVYRWELEGKPLYLVYCDTDGSDGWVELYDADGTVLGYARTDWDCPVWTAKGVARRRAFIGDRDETDEELAKAVKRLRGR